MSIICSFFKTVSVDLPCICFELAIHFCFLAQLVKNPPAMQKTWFNSWVRKIPWRRDRLSTPVFLGFPCGSAGKEPVCNAGDLGSIPGLGRFPGGGHGNPLQYSCLENPHGQRSLAGYSPWAHKWVRHNLVTEQQEIYTSQRLSELQAECTQTDPHWDTL